MQRRTRMGIILLLSAAIPIVVGAFSTGPPAAHTGGFGEPTCTVCHSGTALNGGGGQVSITISGTYSSGDTVPVTVTVSDSTARRWGFELSARTQSGQQAGTLIVGSDGFTQIVSQSGVQYIEHRVEGTRGGTANGVSFNFQWRAPDVSAGPILFHVAGNAANNNFSSSGDHIYTSSATVQPQAPPPPPPPPPPNPPPSVSENGTVNNASFVAGTNPLAPGTIAAIFGTNLNDGSSISDSSFGTDGKLLTTLGGASVTFNGISASLFSSFATQLNVQIPLELAGSTSASVQVTVGGQSSTPRTVPIGSSSPGIFTLPSGGTGQGAVKIANTAIFAAPTGSISGAQTRPANRGEFITIFCTGLGSVTNPPATGRPASASPLSTTIATPQVTIGGVPATVNFSGLSPGFVGLYQVDVQVPAGAPTGNAVTVALTIGGVAANPVTIAVAP